MGAFDCHIKPNRVQLGELRISQTITNKSTSNYFNRDLSWLEFNQRVLDEACDADTPLLERLKFLAITGSNLDEFFMVRVGGLRLLVDQKSTKRDATGMTPDEQLNAIGERCRQMTADQYRCYLDELEPRLETEGIKRVAPSDLSDRQARTLKQVFDEEIYSVLTPIAVSLDRKFPRLINQTINVLVQLGPAPDDEQQQPRFAIIPFGRSANRFITLPSDGGYAYIPLEDAVEMYLSRFFPGEPIVASVAFRISRNADFAVREDLVSDLLSEMEAVLDQRKQSSCVRLELEDRVTQPLLEFLSTKLEVVSDETYRVLGPLDLASLMQLAGVKGFEALKFNPWPPLPPTQFEQGKSMFRVLSERDVLLYHPYESFDPVVRLLEEAASDPDVVAIKQTLYRTARDSVIVDSLIRAAELGKHVTVIIELKARFDEARNIERAKELEQAGVQVIYGVRGLKTHAKVCIIVRREPHGIQRYVHFGTGNYNESTARIYSDVSFMTCNDELGRDAISFFNAVTGYSQPQKFRKVEAAPIGLRGRLLEMIEAETHRKRQGQPAVIMAKLNSLADPQIIDALYAASQAGVIIKLNIRGICCLRPGVEGLSDNICVVSVIDRYLEHSRILFFYHGGDERVFISSADWMPRNLDRRVELLVPIEDKICRDRLVAIVELAFDDAVKGRQLNADGGYTRLPSGNPQSSQETLYRQIGDTVKQAEQSRRTVFDPHRAPGN